MSKNKYLLPIKEEKFPYVVIDSPAHIIVKEGEKIYDLTKAMDFTCKEGTEIYAALSGKVTFILDKVNKTWNQDASPPEEAMKSEEQDGNYVVIEHSNKEFTIYSHLSLHSINVKEGENVKTGQLLGHSGNTGWSMGPHLHFMVHNFPEENKGGYKSLTPNWGKELEERLKEKIISFKKIPKKYLK